ncbi:uncharacterized protein [Aquarana catesbeiana]|uniref:uncharacterized protein n=1 Tax=Aquarana catesbeiana TaxID=8400 RepID=UPI003CC9CBA6
MAASVRAELECSVCLNTFTDPVNLTCGHNFCRVCIDHVLDTQQGPRRYSCPECREEFVKRPVLYRNIALRKILDNILSTDQEETRYPCTYCVDTPVPAVKSCLLCEASLCDKHLGVHSKSTEHVLCDPTTNLNNRKCSVHKKILDYYCTEDSTCICFLCRIDGAHQGHHAEMLNEASQKRKKKLKNVLEKMLMIREETEQRVQRLRDHLKESEEKAYSENERVTALFGELRRQLEDLEKKVLSQISGQAKGVLLSINDLIQDLEIKKDKLSRQMHHIEELCNMTDPLAVLQEPCTGDFCEIQEESYKQKCDKQLQGDLDFSVVSHTIHKGLTTIMTEVAKMMPVFTPLAMSSALPWEKVIETWDDHTELAGALSRELPVQSQHQLHSHSIMEETICSEQPMQEVEENESSSEESQGGKIFRKARLRREVNEEDAEEDKSEEEDAKEKFEGEDAEEDEYEEQDAEEDESEKEDAEVEAFEEEDAEEDESEEEDAEEEEFEEDNAEEDESEKEYAEVEAFEEEDAEEDESEEEDAETEESEEDAEEEEFEEEDAEEDEFEEQNAEENRFEEEDAEEDESEEEDAEEEFEEKVAMEDESEEKDAEEEESEEEDAKGKKSGEDNAEEEEESDDTEEESEEEDAEEEGSEDAEEEESEEEGTEEDSSSEDS